jgi:hypothetical protein
MSKTYHAPRRGSPRGAFSRRCVRFKVRALGHCLPAQTVAKAVWLWASSHGLTPGQASAAAEYGRRYAARRNRAIGRILGLPGKADPMDFGGADGR